MYFDEIEFDKWKFNDALKKYEVAYYDSTIALWKMKVHLERNYNNPNIKKAAKEKCKIFLKGKVFKDGQDKDERNKKATTTAAASTASSSSITNNNYIDTQGGTSTINQNLITHHHSNNDTNTDNNSKRAQKRKIDDINPPADEVAKLFESVQNNNNNDLNQNDSPLFLKLQTRIRVIYPSDTWFVGEVNITEKFIEYQRHCFDIANNQGFILETHAHELLMLSSILLLKPNQHSSTLLNFFSTDELEAIMDNVLNSACNIDNHEDIEFNDSLMISISSILKKLNKKSGCRITAMSDIVKLNAATDQELSLLRCLSNLIEKLPTVEIVDPLGELELTAAYVDPIVFPIFTNYEKKSKLIWPNLVQKEPSLSQNDVNKSRRPDAVIRYLHQHNYAEPRGYDEIKSKERQKDNYDLVRDLVRCVIFGKEAIDIHNMNGNLCFQVVGNHMSFYVVTLSAEGVYLVVQICFIKIPMSLGDLPSFIAQFDDLLKVLIVYEHLCVQAQNSSIPLTYKRPTLDSPSFHSYVDKHKSKFNSTPLIFK